MQLIFIIGFAFIGLWLADAGREIFGLGVGALIGYLLATTRELQMQIRKLRQQLERPTAGRAEVESRQPAAPPRRHGAATSEPERPTPAAAKPEPAGGPARAARPAPLEKTRPAPAPVPRTQAPAAAASAPTRSDPFERAVEIAKTWITTGNVPVKVGVIVSFFGVSFLLKYAIDRQLFSLPIELRYLAVAAGGGVLLGVGWRLRNKVRTYALSLQGGGIGILYLTIFAAFRLHPLLPAPFAFTLLVVLTVATGVLAVLQEARWLAVFGTVGGFLAPVLVSTGSGNHVALFGYYLLLNGAVLGIAWYRAWRELNLLGFVFTFGVGTLWGYEYYRPELFGSTEPFLVAFFVFYQAIAILFARRQPPKLRGWVDGTLVFGTPVIAFALQSRLVGETEYGLAISAIAVAVFYTLIGAWLHRSRPREMRLLVESYVALAVAFATIAIPLALDDRWTAVAWALEGAALVWVGVRQGGLLARASGVVLLAASGLAYVNYGWKNDLGMAVVNGNVLGGMLISLASLFSARCLHRDPQPLPLQRWVSGALFVWGALWWLGTGTAEILDRLPDDAPHAIVAFVAASAAALAFAGRRLRWPVARRGALAFLPLAVLMGLLYVVEYGHVLAGAGALSWFAATIVHFAVLRVLEDDRVRVVPGWHHTGALLIAAMLAWEVAYRMDDAGFGQAWTVGVALLVPIAIAALIVAGRGRLVWPLQRHASAYISAAGVLVTIQLVAIGVAGLESAGSPEPLPYVPVLNPYDLATIIGLVAALYVLVSGRSVLPALEGQGLRAVLIAWAVAAFLLTTIAVVRGVHNIAGIPWRLPSLTASVAVQSALSIYWAILGFAGMIWGARHARRWLWMTGTGLMALVVAKLFLVDLGNTGTLARIVSFLGVGVLLLIVGYFAPAPPRQTTGPGAPQSE